MKSKMENLVSAYENHYDAPFRLCKLEGHDGTYLFHLFFVQCWTHGAGEDVEMMRIEDGQAVCERRVESC